jgi:hypothetical protein
MVVLKKIRAATLMETLVATVIIVLIFMISSFLLNSLFNNTVKHDTNAIQAHMSELIYLSEHQQIKIPHDDEFKDWTISIEREHKKLVFEATHNQHKRTIRIERYELHNGY